MFKKPLTILAEANTFSEELFSKLYAMEESLFVRDCEEHGNTVENPKELFKAMFDMEYKNALDLPEEIRAKIADLRVYVLGYGTEEVCKLINK